MVKSARKSGPCPGGASQGGRCGHIASFPKTPTISLLNTNDISSNNICSKLVLQALFLPYSPFNDTMDSSTTCSYHIKQFHWKFCLEHSQPHIINIHDTIKRHNNFCIYYSKFSINLLFFT